MKNCIAVSFDSVEWSDLYKTLNNKICNECIINHIVNVNDIENSIKKIKPGKSDGFDDLTSLMYELCFMFIYHIYLLLCYIIVLPQNPFVSPL